MADMNGQVALVTGGIRGIGLAICERLMNRGVRVAAGYSSNTEAARQFADKYADRGVSIHQGNVGHNEDVLRVFGEVIDKDGTPYSADIRGVLKNYAENLHETRGLTLNAANEIEGFLFKGPDAERRYHETGKFEYVNTGGYYHSLPGDPLRYRDVVDLDPRPAWVLDLHRFVAGLGVARQHRDGVNDRPVDDHLDRRPRIRRAAR